MLQPLAERHRALSVPELGAAPGAERAAEAKPIAIQNFSRIQEDCEGRASAPLTARGEEWELAFAMAGGGSSSSDEPPPAYLMSQRQVPS